MRAKFNSEIVDIYELPSQIETDYQAGDLITVGDLHANAMKLLFILVRHGIITNMTKENYKKLVAIYKTNFLFIAKEHINAFNELLNQLTFINRVNLLFLGDELADRGQNDYFVLRIFEQLTKHHVFPIILISNHGYEFIHACEKYNEFKTIGIGREHAGSCYNLQLLIDKKLVERSQVLAIYETVYKPLLKSLHYQTDADFSEFLIASHAGIGLNTVQDLADVSNAEYSQESVKAVISTIDAINEQFQKQVTSNTVNQLMKMFIRNSLPYDFLLWNREYNGLDRPEKLANSKLFFVHGHDSSELTKGNIYNLNSELGLSVAHNKGKYTYLYTHGNQVALVPENNNNSNRFFSPEPAKVATEEQNTLYSAKK